MVVFFLTAIILPVKTSVKTVVKNEDDFEKNVEDIVTMVVTAVDSYDIIHGFYSNKDKAGIIILVVNVSFNLMPYSTEFL